MVEQPATIREHKHLLSGAVQRFDCRLVAHTPRLVIVRFDLAVARTAGGFQLPAGSYTLGLFWASRHYNLYRFTAADGAVIGYRFDVVDGVRIRPGLVRFTDLLLDAWRGPAAGDPLRVEDEEEVTAAVAAGLLSPRRRHIIASTRRLLERAHGRIIAEAEAELRRLEPDCSNGAACLCLAQTPLPAGGGEGLRETSDGAGMHDSV